MSTRLVTAFSIVGLLLSSNSVFAHPTLNPHPHSAGNILWEKDGTEDGSDAHNHRSPNSFGGAGLLFGTYNAAACWDDTTYRIDPVGSFDEGHCYINEAGSSSNRPQYTFIGSWPSQAKNRVRDAFNAWSSISADILSGINHVGVEFEEASSAPAADIAVVWQPNSNPLYNGQWFSNTKELVFNSSLTWSYDQSFSSLMSNQWHFYSVALHEVGHVVGLDHDLTTGNIMTPPVGVAANISGLPHVYFNSIDGDSQTGTRDLYAQPPGQPPSSITWGNNHFIFCHLPQCALWNMQGSGGIGASVFNIKRAFSSAGPYNTVQTETSIGNFNVHASDTNLYWKICGVNSLGETCSPSYRTRPECEAGGGPNWKTDYGDASDELVFPDFTSPEPGIVLPEHLPQIQKD